MPSARPFALFLIIGFLLAALLAAPAPRALAAPAAQATPATPAAPASTAPAPTAPEPAAPEPAAPTPAGDPTVTTTRPVNIRTGPGTTYRVLATAQEGETYPITGQNGAGTWWRIDYNGQAAWVIARLVTAADSADVPIVLVAALRGSSAGSSSTGSTSGSVAAPAPAAAAPGAAGSTAAGAPAAPAPSASAPSPTVAFDPAQFTFALETLYTGLNQPTFATPAGDGSGRLFVTERAGRIKVFSAPNTEAKLFLDIEDRVDDSGPEQGLLGLAFAPDYASTGHFYVNYTDNQGDTVVARYTVSADPNAADKQSEQQLLWVDQPAPNHNGGMTTFGPDGRLWVGLGDGGGADDTFGSGQNPNTLLGKIVRLDVGGGTAAATIWGTGLRNPWRFSFDRQTGDLWIADVGQSLFEEINFVAAAQVRAGGLNFGWPVMEGAHCRDHAPCDPGAYTAPFYEYGHAGNGCSVTGGYVYRGAAYPALQGVYLYGDFCSGNIWALWQSPDGTLRNERILPNAAAAASFAEDEAGELYLVDIGGTVRRIVLHAR
jgi:glucose/arabinose dehydrogenase